MSKQLFSFGLIMSTSINAANFIGGHIKKKRVQENYGIRVEE